MAREIPEVVRAAAGLVAVVLDEAKKLPETLPGLPVRVIGLAMQSAMKVQQQYAGFVARGDELFTGLRGEDEPGLATFDDEIEESDNGAAPASSGYRESAFDRADIPLAEVPHTDDHAEDSSAPAAAKPARTRAAKAARPSAKAPARAPRRPRKATAVTDAAVTDAAEQVDGAQQTLEALPEEAPGTDEVLEELAIDEMVADAPVTDAAPGEDVSADVATPAETDTATDEGGTPVAAATGVRTDVGGSDTEAEDAAIATGAAVDAVGAESAAPTDDPEGGSELSGSQAVGTAPIEGYDSFSIAQLRGRLRGYALSTVADLVAYEESTRARAPYLRMLRNRLERLEAQAVESSPLVPRGA